MNRSKLVEILDAIGKPTKTLGSTDGTKASVLPYGYESLDCLPSATVGPPDGASLVGRSVAIVGVPRTSASHPIDCAAAARCRNWIRSYPSTGAMHAVAG
jgi:hypothetical protein